MQPLTGYTGYITPLDSQTSSQTYSKAAGLDDVVRNEITRRGTTPELFAAQFDAKTTILAKSMILVMVPLFAIMVALLHALRQRPFVEHLVFATHYYAFDLIFTSSVFLVVYSQLLLTPLMDLYYAAGLRPTTGLGGALWVLLRELPTAPILITYLTLAFRRTYADSAWGALMRALACVPLLLIVIYVYRFVLFWVTFYAV